MTTPERDMLYDLAADLANGIAADGSCFTCHCDHTYPGLHVVACVDVRLARCSGLPLLRFQQRLKAAGLDPDELHAPSLGRYAGGGHPYTTDPEGYHGAFAIGVRRPADVTPQEADRLIRAALRESGFRPR